LARKIVAAKKRGRAKIPSPQLFEPEGFSEPERPPSPAPEQVRYGTSLFARPSDRISEFSVRIFVKKSSDFNQKAPQTKNLFFVCGVFLK